MNYAQKRTRLIYIFFSLLLFVFFVAGCNENDSTSSFSSSTIGLVGYTEDQQLQVDISLNQCSVGDTISIAVTCRDSGGALIKDTDVIFSSDNGGEFSEKSVKTNDLGTAGVTFVPKKKGTNLISVNANGISKQIRIQVSPSKEEDVFCILSVSSVIVKPNETVTVTVFVYNSSRVPVKDADVSLSSQYGNITEITGKTDERGYFTTAYKAPDKVGVDTITATSLGKTDANTISIWEE